LLSLRAKRSKLVVKNIKHFEIAASQKSLLAMTIQDFFSKLLGCTICSNRSLTPQQTTGKALASGFKLFGIYYFKFGSYL